MTLCPLIRCGLTALLYGLLGTLRPFRHMQNITHNALNSPCLLQLSQVGEVVAIDCHFVGYAHLLARNVEEVFHPLGQ